METEIQGTTDIPKYAGHACEDQSVAQGIIYSARQGVVLEGSNNTPVLSSVRKELTVGI